MTRSKKQILMQLVDSPAVVKSFFILVYILISAVHLNSVFTREDYTIQDFLVLNFLLIPPLFALCYFGFTFFLYIQVFRILRQESQQSTMALSQEEIGRISRMISRRPRRYRLISRLYKYPYARIQDFLLSRLQQLQSSHSSNS